MHRVLQSVSQLQRRVPGQQPVPAGDQVHQADGLAAERLPPWRDQAAEGQQGETPHREHGGRTRRGGPQTGQVHRLALRLALVQPAG